MRILITVASYFPSHDGVQFVTSYLAEGLVQRGHHVHIVTKEYEGFQEPSEMIKGVFVTRFRTFTEHMIHKGDKKDILDYIIANYSKFDVMINVSTQTAFTDWLLPIMDQIHIPKVLHLHSIWDFRFHKSDVCSFRSIALKVFGNFRWGWYFFWNKKAFKQYDAVIHLHQKDHSYTYFKKKYNLDGLILENAAEEPFFQIENVKKEKIIVNVSNYGKMKNQLDTIKAFEKSNISDDWNLIFVGSKKTDYYKKLKEYCETVLDPTKRDKVILRVGLSREQVIELVKKSSIYMTTSLKEAFPISILEAMAAGTPYISSDVGIVKYLGGGLVARTKEEFVKDLEYLTNDEAYRTYLGEEGRREAFEKYRVSKKVDQLEEILNSLVSKE